MYAESVAKATAGASVAVETKGDLLCSVKALVATCCSSRESIEEQMNAAKRADSLWNSSVAITPVLKYYGSKQSGTEKEHLRNLLKGVEAASDDFSLLFFCRLLDALISQGTQKVAHKRHKRLIKADVVSSLVRVLRNRLKNSDVRPKSRNGSTSGDLDSDVRRPETTATGEIKRIEDVGELILVGKKMRGSKSRADPNQPVSSSTTSVKSGDSTVVYDALIQVLMAVGSKDPRFNLKMRVGGLMPLICGRLFPENPTDTGDSPALLKLLCRSVRSPRNAQLAGRQKNVPQRLLQKISSINPSESAQLVPLAKYLEILYFISKNRKTRIQLINDKVVISIYTVVLRHLDLRAAEKEKNEEAAAAVHAELCLVSLALLRMLANNKRAKDELVSLGTIALCERAIGQIASERGGDDPTGKQLQDSLCALCLRCLPPTAFPLTVPYPIRMMLPRPASPTRKRSVSKSPPKPKLNASTASAPSTPTAMGNESFNDDEQMSSDDDCLDEEDDIFCHLGGDTEAMCSDEEDDAPGSKKEVPITHSRQKLTEVTNYSQYFSEYQEGTTGYICNASEPYAKMVTEKVQHTKSVIPFVKIAFPETLNSDVDQLRQPLIMNRDSMKEMVVQEMARARLRAPFAHRIVYDLDRLLEEEVKGPLKSSTPKEGITCDDRTRIGRNSDKDHLMFESRFESGNLRRATQVGTNHYELILSPDVNQVKDHYQWFYFEVSNIKANVQYTFEIINCLKTTSMYSKGMQPVMYSVRDALAGRPGWVRAGDAVCYYRNLYASGDDTGDEERSRRRHFYSIRFNMTFRNKGDICYFAYHYPYTYTFLKVSMDRMTAGIPRTTYWRKDVITTSLGGNPIFMFTITSPGSASEIKERDVIVFTARVHPGESNASWMMHGLLQYLLSEEAAELRNKFMFKVIPCLNPDGVINGSHRCSLAGVDMNRVWDKPNKTLHPEIYHSKGVIQYMVDILKKTPYIFVDLHGHSRKSNVFVFGNNPEESWRPLDKSMKHEYEFMTLPELLELASPSFSFKNCKFSITRAKECSARVAMWRQFNIIRSYTMEATYCGFETGSYRGFQIGTRELKDMGKCLAMSVLGVRSSSERKSAKKGTRRRTVSSHQMKGNSSDSSGDRA